MNKEEFQKLKLSAKHELIKEKGRFIASRFYEGFHIHLFQVDGLFAEVWKRLGLNQIYWIDLTDRQRIEENYLDQITLDIRKLSG